MERQKKTRNKFIGNKTFYTTVLAILLPIVVQNGITNFVSLLDNIMVGRVGTQQMSGVAIVNQLLLVFYISIFGAISGAGIFGAQFWGCGKQDGVRHTFRFKMIATFILLGGAAVLFLLKGEDLIMLYLQGEGSVEEITATLGYAKIYLKLMLIGIIPYAIGQVYISTLRECGETVLSMKAGIAAVLVNLVLNYILIFGHFGAPAMGVAGAAIATVISRYVEAAVTILWSHRHTESHPYFVGIYRSMHVPASLAGKIAVTGAPLLLNEFLWSAGMATLVQCYSIRGLSAVASLNISTTISNVFNVVYLSMGSAIGILVGQQLGAGKMEEARDTDNKLIAFSVTGCLIIGSIMAVSAPIFPMLYNTTDEVKELATWLIRISALLMPINAFVHATYFTLRSGGNTIITFLFDSVFVWLVSIPLAYVLSRYTTLPLILLYLACQSVEIIKCVIGFILLKRGKWIQNIVHE